VVLGDGAYYLTRREDVRGALRNPETFASKSAFDILGSPLPLVPLAFDPPAHTRFRKILQPFFSPHTLGTMLPSLQAQAIEIIEAIAAKDECEAMRELAVPYPSQVFLTLFGLPLEDRDRLIRWKDAIIGLGLLDTLEGADLTPAIELTTYLVEAIAAHRQNPGADILSQLLLGDDPLNDEEALGLSYVFVLTGLDTVTSAIGAALLELARRPLIRTLLRENPDQIAVFVEEMVRLEPPASHTHRRSAPTARSAGGPPARPKSCDGTSGTTPHAVPATTPLPRYGETGALTYRALYETTPTTTGSDAVRLPGFPRRLKPPVPSGRTDVQRVAAAAGAPPEEAQLGRRAAAVAHRSPTGCRLSNRLSRRAVRASCGRREKE
jgi:hypothetical protein